MKSISNNKIYLTAAIVIGFLVGGVSASVALAQDFDSRTRDDGSKSC